MTEPVRPRLGIFGLTSCAGDQLVLLSRIEELAELARRAEIVSFGMASSAEGSGHLDLALVEGSVCTETDLAVLRTVRERAGCLVAIGTCAVWGGIPAMRNQLSGEVLLREMYRGQDLDTVNLEDAHPVSDFVTVDVAVPGCPVEATELLEVLTALLHGNPPVRRDYSVCSECRIAENLCLVRTRGITCCGPITAGGCGARCPGLGVPCYGCRGPVDEPCYDATVDLLGEHGLSKALVIEQIQRYSAPAWVEGRLREEWARDPERRGKRRAER
jgi:coenzyme F420-reducing hydrogenase gamma subunit